MQNDIYSEVLKGSIVIRSPAPASNKTHVQNVLRRITFLPHYVSDGMACDYTIFYNILLFKIHSNFCVIIWYCNKNQKYILFNVAFNFLLSVILASKIVLTETAPVGN